jgi:DNA-3-methyladenine glycosylase II
VKQVTFRLLPTPPYNFRLTATAATHFRGHYGADIFERDIFRRLLDLGECPYLVSVQSLGTTDSPCLEAQLTAPVLDNRQIARAKQQITRILGIYQDLNPFYRMAGGDPVLRRLVPAFRGLHLPQTASVYEALILAILGQQINSHVASRLRDRLVVTYGLTLEVSGITYRCFPRPEALLAAGTTGLRAIRTSARKAQYIADISRIVASRELDLEALRTRADDETVASLTLIPGVGLWTAHWLFIRALDRSDGFPHGDLALRRALGLALATDAPPGPEEALEYSQRWRPFRSYVTAYLFAALRSGHLSVTR